MTTKRYKSVKELMDNILREEDPQFSTDFAAQTSRRQIVRGLATLRNTKNITQEEIAQKMGCAQSRISKIENGLDDDLRISDIQAYLKVLNYSAEINLLPSEMTLVDEIKYYAWRMKVAFDRLTSLAHKDDTIQRGVANFHIEALFNLIGLVKSSARKLHSARHPMPKIRFSLVDEEIVLRNKMKIKESSESLAVLTSQE